MSLQDLPANMRASYSIHCCARTLDRIVGCVTTADRVGTAAVAATATATSSANARAAKTFLHESALNDFGVLFQNCIFPMIATKDVEAGHSLGTRIRTLHIYMMDTSGSGRSYFQ